MKPVLLKLHNEARIVDLDDVVGIEVWPAGPADQFDIVRVTLSSGETLEIDEEWSRGDVAKALAKAD